MRILLTLFYPFLLTFGLAHGIISSKTLHNTNLFIRGGGNNSDNNNEDQQQQQKLTMVPRILLPKNWEKKKKKRAIILMDKFSDYHGGYLEQVALEVYGVAVIHVLSSYLWGYMQQEYPNLKEPNTMGIPSTKEGLKEWTKILKEKMGNNVKIEAIICESDSGLADAEQLAIRLKDATSIVIKKHNGFNEARRNKYLMIEEIKKKAPKLATMKQQICKTKEEALDFVTNELNIQLSQFPTTNNPMDSMIASSMMMQQQQQQQEDNNSLIGKGQYYYFQSMKNKCCIVKPKRGAASDLVFLVSSLSELEHAMNEILGTPILGEMGNRHDSVLIQEFLVGTEYAIDIVSRNGQHKVAALWKYDKRPANNRAFVYFATELIGTTDSIDAEAVCDYATSALDALNIKWGTTHTEIIVGQDDGVCRLVEVNCRQHNMDFAPISMACIGYNALDMLLAAYLGNTSNSKKEDDVALDWSLLPDRPVTRAYGAMVHLVTHAKGELVSVNEDALREIQSMDSTLDLEVYSTFLQPGQVIEPTVDIKTDAGWVQLIHGDASIFQNNYYRILALMPTLFFVK